MRVAVVSVDDGCPHTSHSPRLLKLPDSTLYSFKLFASTQSKTIWAASAEWTADGLVHRNTEPVDWGERFWDVRQHSISDVDLLMDHSQRNVFCLKICTTSCHDIFCWSLSRTNCGTKLAPVDAGCSAPRTPIFLVDSFLFSGNKCEQHSALWSLQGFGCPQFAQ